MNEYFLLPINIISFFLSENFKPLKNHYESNVLNKNIRVFSMRVGGKLQRNKILLKAIIVTLLIYSMSRVMNSDDSDHSDDFRQNK